MKILNRFSLLVVLCFCSAVLCTRDPRDLSHHKGGGGGIDHDHGGYAPPKKCHPQIITKYKTVHKDRKANVVNQVEVLNPRPHVKKVTETRYTTIRYPVFITQVIKPLLMQVETKVKPVFFTETKKKYTTVLFTVTGIGQVTVTTVKYEKEYITRCMKKGYHRREYYPGEEPIVKKADIISLPVKTAYAGDSTELPPPPGIPYEEPFDGNSPHYGERIRSRPRRPSRPPFNGPPRRRMGPRNNGLRRNINRRGSPQRNHRFELMRGDVKDLYSEDIFYMGDRSARFLEASSGLDLEESRHLSHPPLPHSPVRIFI